LPCFGFESGGEGPGATLHGLARYQGEADPLVELQGRVSPAVAALGYGSASPRYTAPLAVFTVLRSSRYLEFAA
jgi:hypothetical protein